MATKITNVFILVLENRSFDHMLGFSGLTGTEAGANPPTATAIRGLSGSESNGYLGAPYFVGKPFHEPVAVDPAHEFLDVLEQLCGTQAVYTPGKPYPSVNNSGFVSDYARSHTRDEGNATGNFGQIMDGFAADQLPVLTTLAKSFAVCDAWHSSLPGPTFPNRLFAMGASSGRLDHSPLTSELLTWEGLDGFVLPAGSIFDALQKKYAAEAWRIYAGSHFPLVSALKGINTPDVQSIDDFAGDVGKTPYPWRLTWIEPDYGDMVFGTFRGGTSQHPMDTVAGGEQLIKRVYEALRASPVWETSLLIITWDEHGGFYDHVPPGKAIAPGDTKAGSKYSQYGFTFTQLGVRVPAVVVSP
ncbi:MAG: alkaline phosphatase family protein, partial [Steroidobacteraceae bacterium]